MRQAKKILAIILSIAALLCSGLVQNVNAASYEVIEVRCVSNLSPTTTAVKLLVKNNDLFIPVPDVKSVSGYSCDNSLNRAPYGQPGVKSITFTRGVESYLCKDIVSFEDYYWVSLNETMHNLQVNMLANQGVLLFDGATCLPSEMYDFIDGMVFGQAELNYGLSIAKTVDLKSKATKAAIASSVVWDSIVNAKLSDQLVGVVRKKLTGVSGYISEFYGDIISDVLEVSPTAEANYTLKSDEQDRWKNLKKSIKNVQSIAKATATAVAQNVNYDVDNAENYDEISKFFLHYDDFASPAMEFTGTTADTIQSVSKKVLNYIDPIGTMFKDATGVKLKGLDIVSVYEVIMTGMKCLKATQTSANVVLNTFYKNGKFVADTKAFPEVDEHVRQLYGYRYGLEYNEFLKNIFANFAVKSIEGFIADKIEDELIGWQAALALKAGSALSKTLLQLVMPDKYEEAKSFYKLGNMLVPLSNLQSVAKKQYNSYADQYRKGDKTSAVSSKYAAMMYTNMFMQYCKLGEKGGMGGTITKHKELAQYIYAILAEIDDNQLQRTLSKASIKKSDLSAIKTEKEVRSIRVSSIPKDLVFHVGDYFASWSVPSIDDISVEVSYADGTKETKAIIKWDSSFGTESISKNLVGHGLYIELIDGSEKKFTKEGINRIRLTYKGATTQFEVNVSGNQDGQVHTHIWSTSWESDENGHWNNCLSCTEKKNYAKHKFGDWSIIRQETEMIEGEKERSCTVCGYKQTETIPKKQTTPVDELYTREGEYIYFGSYPQSEVTDANLHAELTNIAGSTGEWISYGYYNDGIVSDYMVYKDVSYNGERYRGVYFTQYRGDSTEYTLYSVQNENGYHTNVIYWFKYEPIKWEVLTESNGVVLIYSNKIIDSQDFHYSTEYATTLLPNNYENSHIREWLNSSFYNTAFSSAQKKVIKTTEVDNSLSACSLRDGFISFTCNNTKDKLFLLSSKEAADECYWQFPPERTKIATAYANAQGCSNMAGTTGTDNIPSWWLRTNSCPRYLDGPGDISADAVCCGNESIVSYTFIGVVPALRLVL